MGASANQMVASCQHILYHPRVLSIVVGHQGEPAPFYMPP